MIKPCHIVVEGVDNSGKSTLVKEMHLALNLPVQGSEGPPHFPGEMNRRVKRYGSINTPCIFDRHPVVSQLIYGTMRTHQDVIDPELIREFYEAYPIFVYCDPGKRGLRGHRQSWVDTDTHLSQVEAHYTTLLTLYRAWALDHAHLVYRIGDDTQRIIDAVKGMR